MNCSRRKGMQVIHQLMPFFLLYVCHTQIGTLQTHCNVFLLLSEYLNGLNFFKSYTIHVTLRSVSSTFNTSVPDRGAWGVSLSMWISLQVQSDAVSTCQVWVMGKELVPKAEIGFGISSPRFPARKPNENNTLRGEERDKHFCGNRAIPFQKLPGWKWTYLNLAKKTQNNSTTTATNNLTAGTVAARRGEMGNEGGSSGEGGTWATTSVCRDPGR